MSRRSVKRVVAMVVPCTALILGLVTIQLFLVHPGAQAAPAKWRPAGTIAHGRYNSQATTLQNGMVLIEGGCPPGVCTSESELYNPTTNRWTSTGSLHEGRGEQSATLLPNGKVLVAGGYNGSVLNSAELRPRQRDVVGHRQHERGTH
jgi:N-acetylneuraminic acid mutarotase